MADEPSFNVEVVSPEQTLLSVEAVEVYARSLDGEIGILPGHQPALLALDIAPLTVVTRDGERERVAVHEGFLYYQGGELVILADTAETAADIDVERAEQRRRELEEQAAAEAGADLRTSIRRQEVRLQIAERA